MKKFKVLVSVFLSLMLTVSALLACVPAFAADNWVNAYDLTGESSCNAVNAVHFSALVDFTGISAQCGTWGGTVSHTAKLYAWAGDYASSVSGAVVAVANIPAGTDNAFLSASFADANGAAKTVPAGNYLMVFSSSKGDTSYLIKTSDGSSTTQEVYAGGSAVGYQLRFKLNFAAAADKYFGSLIGETVDAFDIAGERSWNEKNAARVKTVSDFTAVSVKCGTWGGTVSHTVTAYPWKGTYETTLAGTPVAVADVGTGADNSLLKGNFTDPSTGKAKTVPAGEYLFLFASSKGETAYLIATNDGDGTSKLQKAYHNGLEASFQFVFKLTFVPNATQYYGDISTGTVTPPSTDPNPQTGDAVLVIPFAVLALGVVLICVLRKRTEICAR